MEPEARPDPATEPAPGTPASVSTPVPPEPTASPSPAVAPSTPASVTAPGSVTVAVEGEQSDEQAAAAAVASAAEKPAELGRRAMRSPRDMAISLLVLMVPIVLLLVFYRVVLSGDAPVTVDPSSTIQEAQAAKAFPVAVPQGLSDDWHVTSATFKRAAEGATLRLGYVGPDKDAALVIESNVPAAQLLPAELGAKAEPRGTFRDGEAAWRTYLSRPGETALVLSDQARTIIVLGNTDEKHLQALAEAFS